jgi:DNA-binding GntR family transcriptional regulator
MDSLSRTNVYTSATTASSLAYQEIKTWLLVGDVPIGIRLREEKLAERLSVSRTPVREALLRLHAEHFLERHVEGGFRATYPSVQTMRELYEIRRALEMHALRRSVPDCPRDFDALAELEEDWRTLDNTDERPDAEFVLLDEDFHRRLAESSGNVQLAEQLRQVNERIRPVRSHDFMTYGRIATTIEQHLAIIGAVVKHQMDAAATLLERHIGESQTVVERAVATVLEKMLSVGERDGSW